MGQIQVYIFEQFSQLVSIEWIADVASCALRVESGHRDDRISVVIADDDTVRDLNSRYRGLEDTTDVLSFSVAHSGPDFGAEPRDVSGPGFADFVLPPGHIPDLGELVISYTQVVRQAREAVHPESTELATLIAHGIFHLLGYDHEEDTDAAVMQSRERTAMHGLVRAGLVTR